MAVWRRPGAPPPKQNPGYASERKPEEDVVILALKVEVSGHQKFKI